MFFACILAILHGIHHELGNELVRLGKLERPPPRLNQPPPNPPFPFPRSRLGFTRADIAGRLGGSEQAGQAAFSNIIRSATLIHVRHLIQASTQPSIHPRSLYLQGSVSTRISHFVTLLGCRVGTTPSPVVVGCLCSRPVSIHLSVVLLIVHRSIVLRVS